MWSVIILMNTCMSHRMQPRDGATDHAILSISTRSPDNLQIDYAA